MKNSLPSIVTIEKLFKDRGAAEYHGEAVTQLEHALQSATAAEATGATAGLITAALLHDIGHLLQSHGEQAAEHGIDDRHEELGQRFLRRHFGPEVTEPVRLHVAAKRYLCTIEPEYLQILSHTSQLSLYLQGGPMSAAEVADFEANAHGREAVTLRRWDDIAKVPGLATAPLPHFLQYVKAVLPHETE